MLLISESDMLARRWHMPTHPLRRDKRYLVPVLAVDIDNEAHATCSWSTSHVILADFRLCQIGNVGQLFSGSFTLEGIEGFGLFDASITKVDRSRGLVLAQFTQISVIGLRLIAQANALHPKRESGERPEMTIRLAYPTADWSLSGLALAGCPQEFSVGQCISGTIRQDRSQETGAFTGVVVRTTCDPDIMALRILTRSTECFDLMEGAIRKQSLHENPPSIAQMYGVAS